MPTLASFGRASDERLSPHVAQLLAGEQSDASTAPAPVPLPVAEKQTPAAPASATAVAHPNLDLSNLDAALSTLGPDASLSTLEPTRFADLLGNSAQVPQLMPKFLPSLCTVYVVCTVCLRWTYAEWEPGARARGALPHGRGAGAQRLAAAHARRLDEADRPAALRTHKCCCNRSYNRTSVPVNGLYLIYILDI